MKNMSLREVNWSVQPQESFSDFIDKMEKKRTARKRTTKKRVPTKVAPKRMTHKQYVEYIKSTHWSSFKEKYYLKYDKVCAKCGTDVEVDLHHKTYDRIGKERISDVVPLCREHHLEVHKFARSRKAYSLAKATDLWLGL